MDRTFELARRALQSSAKYFPHVSIYDLRDKLDEAAFDIVLCLGVHYQLKYPLLALGCKRKEAVPGPHVHDGTTCQVRKLVRVEFRLQTFRCFVARPGLRSFRKWQIGRVADWALC